MKIRHRNSEMLYLAFFIPLLVPTVGYAEATITGTITDQTESLAITLRLRDTAQVPNDVLTKAQGGVTRIYREAGVEALWLILESLSAESDAARQAALTVAILSVDQRARLHRKQRQCGPHS
jgi:hypothetical protein